MGSFSEIEVSGKQDWTPADVLERGLRVLNFLESRWSISLGSRSAKVRILGLSFLLSAGEEAGANDEGILSILAKDRNESQVLDLVGALVDKDPDEDEEP